MKSNARNYQLARTVAQYRRGDIRHRENPSTLLAEARQRISRIFRPFVSITASKRLSPRDGTRNETFAFQGAVSRASNEWSYRMTSRKPISPASKSLSPGGITQTERHKEKLLRNVLFFRCLTTLNDGGAVDGATMVAFAQTESNLPSL